jgi:hypothetical protein
VSLVVTFRIKSSPVFIRGQQQTVVAAAAAAAAVAVVVGDHGAVLGQP